VIFPAATVVKDRVSIENDPRSNAEHKFTLCVAKRARKATSQRQGITALWWSPHYTAWQQRLKCVWTTCP